MGLIYEIYDERASKKRKQWWLKWSATGLLVYPPVRIVGSFELQFSHSMCTGQGTFQKLWHMKMCMCVRVCVLLFQCVTCSSPSPFPSLASLSCTNASVHKNKIRLHIHKKASGCSSFQQAQRKLSWVGWWTGGEKGGRWVTERLLIHKPVERMREASIRRAVVQPPFLSFVLQFYGVHFHEQNVRWG